MHILTSPVSRYELFHRFTSHFPGLVKAVVDVRRRVMAVDAEWHADLEVLLLEDGSAQEDVWGINLVDCERPDELVVFESLINIRPAQQHFAMEIVDPALRDSIRRIVDKLVGEHPPEALREAPTPYAVPVTTPAISHFGAPTAYPCFKHHRELTMAKWRSFEAHKRVLMIANEFGRAKALIAAGNDPAVRDCYERALELFHITIEAGRIETVAPDIVVGLLRLRERTAGLLIERRLDAGMNEGIRDALIRLDPVVGRMLGVSGAEAGANVDGRGKT